MTITPVEGTPISSAAAELSRGLLHTKAADHQTAADPANMTAHQTTKTTATDRATDSANV